jgi:hypothetical protein
MNWDDTIGQNIHANMYNKAMQVKPNADPIKLHESIHRASITVEITRQSIADVIEAEIECLAFMEALDAKTIPLDFISGMLAVLDLVREGKHVLDNNSHHNKQ